MAANPPRFTPFGERARGNQQPKKKKRVRSSDAGIAPRQTKRDLTPKGIATEKLKSSLNKDFTISDTLRDALANEMSRLESLRYMNMKTLAGALVYLHGIGNDRSRFSDMNEAGEYYRAAEFYQDPKVEEIAEKLLPEQKRGVRKVLTSEEKRDLIVRQKISLLRYIRAVNNYREELEAEARNAQFVATPGQ